MAGADEDTRGSSPTPSSSEGFSRVRATSTSSSHHVNFDRPQDTVITAEIPTVRSARPATAQIRYAAPRQSGRQQSWRARPDAAAAPLRLLVWIMLFFFILLFVGFIAVIVHPTWLSFLRHTVATPQAIGVLSHLVFS